MILFWKLENKNEKLLWEFLSANSFLDTSLRVWFLCENMISYKGEEGSLALLGGGNRSKLVQLFTSLW